MHHPSWFFPGACTNIYSQTSDAAFQDASMNVNTTSNKKHILGNFEVNSLVRSINRNAGIQLPAGGFVFRAANQRNKKWRSADDDDDDDGNKRGKSFNDFLSTLNDSVDRVAANESTERTNTSSLGSFRSSKEQHDSAVWNDLINLVSTTAHEFRRIKNDKNNQIYSNDYTDKPELVEIYSERNNENKLRPFRAMPQLQIPPKHTVVEQDKIIRAEPRNDRVPLEKDGNMNFQSYLITGEAELAPANSHANPEAEQQNRFGSRSWPVFVNNDVKAKPPEVEDFEKTTDPEEPACCAANKNDEESETRVSKPIKQSSKIAKRKCQKNTRKKKVFTEMDGEDNLVESSNGNCDRGTRMPGKKGKRPPMEVASKSQCPSIEREVILLSTRPSRIAIFDKNAGRGVYPVATNNRNGTRSKPFLDHENPSANTVSSGRTRVRSAGIARCATRPTSGVPKDAAEQSFPAERSLQCSSSVTQEPKTGSIGTSLEGAGISKHDGSNRLPAKNFLRTIPVARSKTFVDHRRQNEYSAGKCGNQLVSKEATCLKKTDEKSEFQEKHAKSLRMLKNILSHSGSDMDSSKRNTGDTRSRISLESATKSQLPVSISRSSRNRSSLDSPKSSKTLLEKPTILAEPRDSHTAGHDSFASGNCETSKVPTRDQSSITVETNIAKSFEVAETQTLPLTVADKNSNSQGTQCSVESVTIATSFSTSTKDASTDCRQAIATASSSKNVASGRDSETVFISRESNTENIAAYVKSRGVCFRGARKVHASCQVGRPSKHSKDSACGDNNTIERPLVTVDRAVDVFGPQTVEKDCQSDTRLTVEIAVGNEQSVDDERNNRWDDAPTLGTLQIHRDVATSFGNLERYQSRCSSGSSLLVWQEGLPALNVPSTSSLNRLPPEHLRNLPRRAIPALRILVEGNSDLHRAMEIFRTNSFSRTCVTEQLESTETLSQIETKESPLAVTNSPICFVRDETISIVIDDLLQSVVRKIDAKRETEIVKETFEITQRTNRPDEKYESVVTEREERWQFSILSRNSLLTIVYGTVCSFVFWALQFSITCDPL